MSCILMEPHFWPQMTCILRILTFQETKTTISNWHTNNEKGWKALGDACLYQKQEPPLLAPQRGGHVFRLFSSSRPHGFSRLFPPACSLHSLLFESIFLGQLFQLVQASSWPHHTTRASAVQTALLGTELWAHRLSPYPDSEFPGGRIIATQASLWDTVPQWYS